MTWMSGSARAQRSVAMADPVLRGLTVASSAGLLGAELVAAEPGATGLLRVAALMLGTLISVLMAALAPDPVGLLAQLRPRLSPAGRGPGEAPGVGRGALG